MLSTRSFFFPVKRSLTLSASSSLKSCFSSSATGAVVVVAGSPSAPAISVSVILIEPKKESNGSVLSWFALSPCCCRSCFSGTRCWDDSRFSHKPRHQKRWRETKQREEKIGKTFSFLLSCVFFSLFTFSNSEKNSFLSTLSSNSLSLSLFLSFFPPLSLSVSLSQHDL